MLKPPDEIYNQYTKCHPEFADLFSTGIEMKQTRHQLRRLYWIDVAFQWGNFPSAPLLARELGVSRGAIHRDLQTLRTEFHAPVAFDPTQSGYIYARDFRPDLPDLPAEEAIELAVILTRSGEIEDSALAASLHRLGSRVIQLLPRGMADELGNRTTAGEFSPSDSQPSSDTQPPEEPVAPADELHPAADGEEAEPVEIQLRFDQTIAAQVLSAHIFRQNEVQYLTDGGIEVIITTRCPDEFLRSLLRWAPDFEVANPPWIRRKLPQLLQRILKQYQ